MLASFVASAPGFFETTPKPMIWSRTCFSSCSEGAQSWTPQVLGPQLDHPDDLPPRHRAAPIPHGALFLQAAGHRRPCRPLGRNADQRKRLFRRSRLRTYWIGAGAEVPLRGSARDAAALFL